MDTPDNHARFQPAWIFGQSQSNLSPKPLAETISHEVGHNFNLQHDGDQDEAYYEGHGPWTPIMGFSDFRPISQWSVGDYPGADNTQNDINVIASHGAPLRTDEGSTWPTGTSYVTTRTDTDAFVLPGTCTAPQTITAAPSAIAPNLDIKLTVLDSDDSVVATDNPASATVNADVASGMGAAVTLTSITDTYRVVVDGIGNPAPAPGYSDYGSVGAYTLLLTPGCAPGPDPDPVDPTAPSSARIGTAKGGAKGGKSTAKATWQQPTSDGGSAIAGYRVVAYRLNRGGGVVATLRTGWVGPTLRSLNVKVKSGRYGFAVEAKNAAGNAPLSARSNTVKAR